MKIYSCPIAEFEKRYDNKPTERIQLTAQGRALRMLRKVAEEANKLGRQGAEIRGIELVVTNNPELLGEPTVEIYLHVKWALRKPADAPAYVKVTQEEKAA